MLKVGNRKVIARLANRSLFAAKLRNMMAVCAIALTAVLFTTLFTLGIGSVEAFQQATMRQSGGSGHASAKYIDDGTFEKISRHPLVREISYNRILCDSVDNPELLKRRGELWYHDDAGLRHSFSEPTAGSKPVAENEIIMDTQTLRLLNVPQEIGAKVKLLLTVKGRQVEREFALSGWWEADPAFNVSSLIVSRAYVDAHLSELENTYEQDWSMAGTVHAYVMFGNTFGMEEKFNRVLTESGFNATDPESPDYVEGAVNWAYVSAGFGGDPVATGAVIVGALLIIFTGYLIIYNIFQISVLRDIRYYGLLKTIGATGRQIKRIIRRQAAALSAVGIPVGLALGFLIGAGLVPLVLDISNYAGAKTEVSADPLIFTGSALFAAFTVWISTRKPGRLAAKVSPVEAVRYTDVETGGGKKEKQSANGGKLYKMALSNLGRNKKRTALVLTSLSLSLVLLNTVFTLSQGVDMDKYLSKFVDTDFLFAHADYFNNRYYSAENAVSEEDIAAIEAQPGFEAGGRLYQTALEYFTVEDESYDLDYNRGADGFPFIEVYGLDDLPLNRLEVVAGEIDREKLKSGGYILQGVALDDYGRPQTEALPFSAGDKVVLHNHRLISPETEETEYTTQEYEIMATVKIKGNTNSNRRWSAYAFYLPANIYLPLTYEKAIMSYAYNISAEKEAEAEAFIKHYTETESPLTDYDSKVTAVNEFNGLRMLILSVGGVLSGIIALVGVLNLINSMLTSIITRRREFVMMQSIGMTRKQLRNMLCMEGLYYAAGTVVFSLTVGVGASLLVVRNLMDAMWFLTYKFVIFPMAACWPVYILIAALIPVMGLKSTVKESLVERLREVE